MNRWKYKHGIKN